mmetsp:Transcript_21599/g.53564  ORF Transcript_21599/g.53564 Transcript_21599/m.53564 type:complete len:212 (-) Transcript_21599:1193-1828(-)
MASFLLALPSYYDLAFGVLKNIRIKLIVIGSLLVITLMINGIRLFEKSLIVHSCLSLCFAFAFAHGHILVLGFRFRDDNRFFFDPNFKLFNGTFQLPVPAHIDLVRIVVDLNVGFEPHLFDSHPPAKFIIIVSNFGRGGDSPVYELIVGGKPDATTPCPFANYPAQAELGNSPRDAFSVARGFFVHQNHHMATEGVVLVPADAPSFGRKIA